MTQAQPKYKPFDLEAAKAGAALITRDGRAARFVAYVPEEPHTFRVLAHVTGERHTMHFCDNGAFLSGEANRRDLFMAPVKRTVWVNLYGGERGDDVQVGQQVTYATQEAAAAQVCTYIGRYLGTFALEFTE
ncbi:hypothetical protein [Pandoraea sputorum]|uniref:hypothetical protein n=1 Tax=Pandoraea sputorum TaxID=93222 RepID=UPI002F3F8819